MKKARDYNHVFLPDDYDLLRYCIVVDNDDYKTSENCFFYINVLVDGSNRICKIEKYKDIYLTRYITRRFPNLTEKRSELVLRDLTEVN